MRAIALAAIVAAAGCAKRQTMEPATLVPAQCEILPPPFDVPDTISVALFDLPDPAHAPLARNAGEKLLFHHLYETLITVDCLGEVRGALAASWEKGSGGRRWTFQLREGARFWNGKPVTAWDVEWWWKTAMRPSAIGDGGIDSISVASDRTLNIFFAQGRGDVPLCLASPAFAVAAPSYESRWPHGTGPFRLDATPAFTRSLIIRPAFGGTTPVIRFVPARVRDARDLIGAVVDALVTADPEVVEYAEGRGELSAVALPWDRTYVLLATSRAAALRDGEDPASLSTRMREGLAADAVRSDARGCETPFWWQEVADCENLSAPGASPANFPRDTDTSQPRRVLYDAGDPVARDLAERMVALLSERAGASSAAAEMAAAVAAAPGGAPQAYVAQGVVEHELAFSARWGSDFAYVFPLPRRAADPCFEARKLLTRIPWLATAGKALPKVLIPLVDTRSHLIADAETVGAAVDWYANILLHGWSLLGDDLP